jgi:hypothetical protein
MFVMAIMKPISSVTTTVTSQSTTTTSETTTTTTTLSQATQVSPLFGPPPTRILGYFVGCPAPAIPFLRIPAPIIARITQRCNIAPPWIRVIPRWNVNPARFTLTSSRAF